ncbi:MAG: aminopeptidase [Patescibacteria group bacterium]
MREGKSGPTTDQMQFLAEAGAEGREAQEFAETVANAEWSLRDFLALKSEESVLILHDKSTNPEMVAILEKAVENIGSARQSLGLVKKAKGTKETKRREIQRLLESHPVVIDISVDSHKATEDIFDDIEDSGSRLLALYDLSPEAFRDNGASSESLEDLEYRLNKMEAILSDAAGFRITSEYGTNLEVGLRPFKERRWAKDTGVIDQPGQWDNLPGGEIYTTPDERMVNGTLVLPALESTIANEQGVDKFVRLEIKDGLIVSIQGGESADKLKKKLEKIAQSDQAEGKNPQNVYRIAEIGFGANSKARSTVADPDQPYNAPGVSVVETEKRYGTMHLAFGDAEHGEEGVEGFETAGSHYDFVIPRNGLTVESFRNNQDFAAKKNGRRIIASNGWNFS